MAFYSTSVFQMLEALAKMLKSEIRDIEENLKEAVQKVERMRGVGYDNTLRYYNLKLCKTVSNIISF